MLAFDHTIFFRFTVHSGVEKMLVDGLYSYSSSQGQIIGSVTIRGEVGWFSFAEPGTEEPEDDKRRRSLKFGVFTNSDKRGLDATGAESYNIEIESSLPKHGVVSSDGKKITMTNGNIYEFMDEEAIKKMKANKDPAENMPNNYEPQPRGPIVWISGMSGMGKTTTARLLQEKEGFVNYEGDCFIMGYNPYVGAAPKGPSYFGTRPLTGITQERKDVCKLAMNEGYMNGVLKGKAVDPKIWSDFYTLLCEDILKERAKLGGRWVVNQAVYSKVAREVIREKLGDDLTMVVLVSDDQTLQTERLAKRALGEGNTTQEARKESEESMKRRTGGGDAVEDDEPNTYAVKVTKAMTPEDVVEIVLSLVRKRFN